MNTTKINIVCSNREIQLKRVEDLHDGDVFISCGDLYLALDELDPDTTHRLTARLSDGFLARFNQEDKVEVISSVEIKWTR